MNIPSKLYRGINFSAEKLKGFNLAGKDMITTTEARVNEDGKMVVGDGNEYGVYMTDNQTMVDNVYGKPHGTGQPISKVMIDHRMVALPRVGIAYEIDPQKAVNLRKPWISSVLQGHYNNGFSGDEWIADKIPVGGYRVTKIEIGNDILHESQSFNIEENDNIKSVQDNVNKIVEERTKHLQALTKYLGTCSEQRIRAMNGTDVQNLKFLFGDDGLAYKDVATMDVSTYEGQCDFFIANLLKEGKFTPEKYRHMFNIRKPKPGCNSLVERLKADLEFAKQKKKESMQEPQTEMTKKKIENFSEREKFLQGLIDQAQSYSSKENQPGM